MAKKPPESTYGRQRAPRQRRIGHVPAAHRPAFPDSGERVNKGEDGKEKRKRAEDRIDVVGVCGCGATSGGAVRVLRLLATLVPSTERETGAHRGPVDEDVAEAPTARVAEAIATLQVGGDGATREVALDPRLIAVGDNPRGRDEALPPGPVGGRGLRHSR